MAQVKYPDGTIREIKEKSPIKKTNAKKAKLGMDFEERINEANNYYLVKEIASIYKKPTPIKIVKVDYPTRSKAKITEAYYQTPSTTDYNGIYRKKYIDFEAKSCREKSFSFEKIYVHQIEHLQTIEKMGGISFLIIEFSSVNEVYILPTNKLVEKYNESLNGGRKSIPYEYFKENGERVLPKLNIFVDYLTAVDKVFFSENNK